MLSRDSNLIWLWLPFAAVLAAVAGAGVFLALATWSDRLGLLASAASAVFALVLAGLARWILPAGEQRRRQVVLITGVGLGVLVLLARLTVLRPMGSPYLEARETPEIGYWQLDTGSRIAYQKTEPAAPGRPSPVIFLHGGPGLPELPPGSVTAALVASGFEVYGYHQFGCGLSSRAADREREYTVARHVADLEAIRRQIGAERIIPVGQSWGGTLAASYAAAYPERLERVVLTAPAPAFLPAFGLESLRMTRVLEDGDLAALRDLVMPHIPRLALWRLLQQLQPAAAEALLSERQYDAFSQAQTRIMARAFACRGEAAEGLTFAGQAAWVNRHVFADLERVEDPRPALRRVSAPVLILKPECDYVDEAIVADYQEAFADARIVYVEGAGHEIKLEREERYIELIRDFLLESDSGV